MKGQTRPVWVEINLANLKYNLGLLKERVSADTIIMAVVKADAYGHGVLPVSKTLVESGVKRLAVALPEEGFELREAGFSLPIQVMSEILPPQDELLLDYDLIPTIGRMDTALRINTLAEKKGIKKKVHIKIDTGMGRIGVCPEMANDFIMSLSQMDNLIIEGIMTHFATADEADKVYTHQQWERFQQLLNDLSESGFIIPIRHAANSATLIDLPEFQLNMVRPGIALYGLHPSHEMHKKLPFKPVLSWKSKVVYLKNLPLGSSISYGAAYITSRDSKIATIPLGYADGYSRLLSNKAHVLINGQKAPVRGKVCMDQFMVDVTDISDVNIGSEVVLVGKQGNEEITATEMAEIMGTINYEFVCNISNRVPRIYR
ncbi:alanine racemase [Halocella sp. SP3-1]|uniref:alanine racemase n=1 Tax=Halocella sp. SP3-1 TaxID=2382161 RepID=UPI000F75DC03|nr:alanine racemase [Halocella sp. SP3-1]AZO96502.1 alanine racemase [Halocella sp. SP3-1]